MVPEEQDVHADHDGHHREHVKRDGCPVSHRFIVVCTMSGRLAFSHQRSPTPRLLDNLGFNPVVADIGEFRETRKLRHLPERAAAQTVNTEAPGKRGNKVPHLAGHWQ